MFLSKGTTKVSFFWKGTIKTFTAKLLFLSKEGMTKINKKSKNGSRNKILYKKTSKVKENKLYVHVSRKNIYIFFFTELVLPKNFLLRLKLAWWGTYCSITTGSEISI